MGQTAADGKVFDGKGRQGGKETAVTTQRGLIENKRVRERGGWSEREEKRNSVGPCGVSRDIKSYYVYAMPPPKYSLLRYRVLMELL